MRISGPTTLALCALALSACTMEEDGRRRPPARSGLVGSGASTSGDPAASGWDSVLPSSEAAPYDPMRPRSVTRGDPEPLLARPTAPPTPPPAPFPEAPPLAGVPPTAPPAYAQPAGTLPVPPPMDAPPPLPAPRAAFSPGSSPRAGNVPTPEAPTKAPLLPGAKAPGGSASDPLYFSFLGKELPDLAPDGVWLTPGISSSISGLRGQVVYLQFAFQSCPSCGLTTPYLQQWQQSYGPQGLSIIYVNNGLMANREAAEKAIAEQKLLFPYFHDPSGESLRIYGVRAFPTAYVVDRAGKVVWEGTPTANEPRIGELIQSLLLEK